MKILHGYVHSGIESEELKEWGEVTGLGLECKSMKNFDNFIQCDLSMDPFKVSKLIQSGTKPFWFGLFHPPCGRWSRATPPRHKPNFPNLLPGARVIARALCKYWVIENVPRAPLREPLRLEGNMFDIPLKYERHFETNYPIEQPPMKRQVAYPLGIQSIRKEKARVVKGYTGNYPVKDITRNALPKQYVKYLIENTPLE